MVKQKEKETRKGGKREFHKEEEEEMEELTRLQISCVSCVLVEVKVLDLRGTIEHYRNGREENALKMKVSENTP